MTDDTTIRIEKTLDAPIERVFDAWLDPKGIAVWMCPAEGTRVPDPKLDARVGGQFDFSMDVGGELLPHVGEYTVIDRPRVLEFTWKSPGTHQLDTRVTLEFSSPADGKTLLRLTHRLLPNTEASQMHQAGWQRIVDCLAKEITS